MTMGPDPMMSILCMSVRLGIVLSFGTSLEFFDLDTIRKLHKFRIASDQCPAQLIGCGRGEGIRIGDGVVHLEPGGSEHCFLGGWDNDQGRMTNLIQSFPGLGFTLDFADPVGDLAEVDDGDEPFDSTFLRILQQLADT